MFFNNLVIGDNHYNTMMVEEVLQEKIRENNDIQEEILSIINCCFIY